MGLFSKKTPEERLDKLEKKFDKDAYKEGTKLIKEINKDMMKNMKSCNKFVKQGGPLYK